MLAEALDERTPLLERAKFLAIFTSNLDEFFMKRQAVLRQGATDAQRALAQQVRDKLLPSLRRQAECYRQVVFPAWPNTESFCARGMSSRRGKRKREASTSSPRYLPRLPRWSSIPFIHFPFSPTSRLLWSSACATSAREETMFARVKVPGSLKQWVFLESDLEPGQKLLVSLYELIRGNLPALYSGMEISNVTMIRITRDAEVEVDDDSAADFRTMVREQIRQRRYEPVVRLEYGAGADPAIVEMLRARFELAAARSLRDAEEVDYTSLFELLGSAHSLIAGPRMDPLWPAALPEGQGAIFAAMRAGDMLVHHPYESFDASVEHFISAAADDPQTVSIKMTAYRIGDDTPFVKSLDTRGGAGQTSGLRHGNQGALRRGTQPALGSRAGTRRRARYLWRERTQNPRQDSAGGAQGGQGTALLRAYRHR